MYGRLIFVENEEAIGLFKNLFPSYEIKIADENIKRRFEYYFKRVIAHGIQVPRIGFYLIEKIYKKSPNYNPNKKEYFANAHWKLNEDEPFFTNAIEEIRLKPLYNKYSIGPASPINEMDLLHKVIHIKNVSLIDCVDYKTYKVEWSILNN